MSHDTETVIRREGRAGRITLNRPKALNALTYPMVGEIQRALTAWESDPEVQLVILDGAGERGLCAGGDVRSLYDARTEGSSFARRFWREEYVLNDHIGRYPKPYVALMDGIVMGGGIGLSAHASHRIVTERSMLAMPETTIGLIPDVGGTFLLSRAPGASGEYLGLMGHRMNAGDALYAGFADTMVETPRLPLLLRRLCHTQDPVSVTIAEHAGAPAGSPLADQHAEIDAVFSRATLIEIRDTLAGMPGDWAQKTLADLAARSPLAMTTTLAAIRRARTLASLKDALDIEYRLCVNLYEHGEFLEGIRALIVDKDKTPRWRPPRLDDVTDSMIEPLFAPVSE
jgi:enoyl-CoA hydratase